MSATKAAQIVQERMKSGCNCCQALIIATGQVLNISVSEETLAAASMFGQGMGSGCSCGALVGMIMMSGILQTHSKHPLGPKLNQKLHNDFKEQFGSTCCRAIRKRHNVLQNIGNRFCIDLTSQAAVMLVEEWKGVLGDVQHIDYNSYAK
jgi:C_GCAxxG_C_C family probable redox protein